MTQPKLTIQFEPKYIECIDYSYYRILVASYKISYDGTSWDLQQFMNWQAEKPDERMNIDETIEIDTNSKDLFDKLMIRIDRKTFNKGDGLLRIIKILKDREVPNSDVDDCSLRGSCRSFGFDIDKNYHISQVLRGTQFL